MAASGMIQYCRLYSTPGVRFKSQPEYVLYSTVLSHSTVVSTVLCTTDVSVSSGRARNSGTQDKFGSEV